MVVFDPTDGHIGFALVFTWFMLSAIETIYIYLGLYILHLKDGFVVVTVY